MSHRSVERAYQKVDGICRYQTLKYRVVSLIATSVYKSVTSLGKSSSSVSQALLSMSKYASFSSKSSHHTAHREEKVVPYLSPVSPAT